MDNKNLIQVKAFCHYHQIEMSFVNILHEFSLIEIQYIDDNGFIPQQQLPELEKMVRLNRELNINPEGLDAVLHLLQKIEEMQQEMNLLKNRLKLYE